MTDNNNAFSLKAMDLEDLKEYLAGLDESDYRFNKKTYAKDLDMALRDLDAIRKDAMGDDSDGGGSVADELVAMIIETATLFHGPDKTPYAQFDEGDHKENWPIQSKHFHEWASRLYWNEHEQVANSAAVKSAIDSLIGMAKFDGQQNDVAVRTAVVDDVYYIDLCNDRWEVVRIKAGKWKVLADSPVRFIRNDSMLPLPTPAGNGDLDKLWRFVHVRKADRSLLLATMVETFRPDSPYPVTEITGFAGSGKSTLQKYIRNSLDPNTQPLRSAPGSVQDIFIGAANSLITSLNNISHLSPQQQDALCVLSTGGGYSTRELYTNLGEVSVDVKRPVMINGIHPSVTATDLVDRLVHFKLDKLESFTAEKVLDAEFADQHRKIFTGLLDLFSTTLRILPSVQGDDSIRLVDFAILGEAVFQALGEDRTFAELFGAKRIEAQRASMESSPCMMALQPFLASQSDQVYHGPYGKLLEDMKGYRTGGDAWPTSGRGISALLTRFADGLVHFGVMVTFDSNHYRDGSHVHLKLVDVDCDEGEVDEHPSGNGKGTGVPLADDDAAFKGKELH